MSVRFGPIPVVTGRSMGRGGAIKTLGLRRTAPARTNFSPEPVVYPTDGEESAPAPARLAPARLDEEQLAPLVERARNGDPGAFEEIVETMQGPVRAFARRTPFRPFILEFTSGGRVLVEHPEGVAAFSQIWLFRSPRNENAVFPASSVCRLLDPSLGGQ